MREMQSEGRKALMKRLEVAAAMIFQAGKILICQRPENKNCGLLWEFPGGKLEAGETAEQCVARECQEELGVRLRVGRELTDVVYEYPDRVVHIRFFACAIAAGELEKKEHNALAWIAPEEIGGYEFCPADVRVLSSAQFAEFCATEVANRAEAAR